jgi:hypothetical protein
MAGALIVTAELAPPDLAWLDDLRRAHYPPERNRLPAHLTMFHALPPSLENEARHRLSIVTKTKPPKAVVAGVIDLGGGVAFRIVSEELDAIRAQLSEAFHGMLGAQDAGGWRPHVTIQNKVPVREARKLIDALEASFHPRPLGIRGLGLHRYLDGPWEKLQCWNFRL